MAADKLPAAVDVERLILGAAMTDAKALLAMLSSLQPLDFLLRKHQLIFTAMRELHMQGQSVDRVTLAHRLEETGDLRRIDGLSYLVSLDDGLPQLYGLESYIRTVQEAAMRRRLIHAARAIASEAAEGAGTATELLERAEQQLRGIGGKRTDGDFLSLTEYLKRESPLEDFLNPARMKPVLPLPWQHLNAILGGGFRRGELVIIAGRPSHGKSAVAGAICHYAGKCGRHGLLASLEMGKAEIWRRMIAAAAQVNMQHWRKGRLSNLERREVAEAARELAELPVYVSDQPSRTVLSLHAALQRHKAAGRRADYVVIDYLQLLRGADRTENRVQEVSQMTRDLKLLAAEHQIPVIALSQIRRYQDEDEKPPSLSMLRESGTIEQDADIVLVIWQRRKAREEAMEAGNPVPTRISVEKQRNGPIGAAKLVFHPRYLRLEDDVDG